MDQSHKLFIEDMKRAILEFDNELRGAKVPSTTFSPSGMHCERAMYYKAKGQAQHPSEQRYNWNQAAKIGSLRHEAIQEVLLGMNDRPGYDWEYVDVKKYVEAKQKEGKCLDIEIGQQQGAETHLYNRKLNLSFLCDGIIKKKSSGEYFLFEFKNKKSTKWAAQCYSFPNEHYDQVVCYCMCLDLEKVFLVMENRDTCELVCPELFIVTDDMKAKMKEKIERVLNAVKINKAPRKLDDEKDCYFCAYKYLCQGK